MWQPYTYLLINLFTIIICVIASFDKRLQFNKYFGAYLLGASLVALPFIMWDIWFTKLGIWWFDTNYTIGWQVAGLPIEEHLFFFCIPFSCLFTYYCFEKFFDWTWAPAFNNLIAFVTIVVCLLMGFLHTDKLYTCLTAFVTAGTMIGLHLLGKVEWITSASLTYAVLMLVFFPVNGILTGTGLPSPIVNYNSDGFMGLRLLTIPIEDAVYGYSQFLLNIAAFKWMVKILRLPSNVALKSPIVKS